MTQRNNKNKLIGREKMINSLQAVQDALMQQGVEFAYLFGSVAEGKAGPLSDVDVAVYLDPGLSRKQRFEKRLQCIGIITQALQRNDVDVVVINDTDADLVQDVLVHGVLIFCHDPGVLADFRYQFTREYLDFAYYREQYWRASLDRIKRKELPHGLRETYRQAIAEIRQRFGTAEADSR